MCADGDDGGEMPVHDVLAGLDALDAALDLLAGAASGWSLGQAGAARAVTRITRQSSRLEAARLGLIRLLDTLDAEASADVTGFAAVDAQVAANVEPRAARAALAAARETDPDSGRLPLMGAALAGGDVTARHVEVATRAVATIPRRLLAQIDEEGRTGAQIVDSFLAEHARALTASSLGRVAAALLEVLDPDRVGRLDPDAAERRRLAMTEDATGMTVGRFQLDPAGGAVLRAAIELLSRPGQDGTAADPHGTPTTVRDDRSAGQRQADALVALARAALSGRPAVGGRGGGGRGGGTAAPAATIVEVASPEQLAAAAAARESGGFGLASTDQPGPGLTPAALGLLGCDAAVQIALRDSAGAVLRLGRATRRASTSQRRALIVRDRGCCFPGCEAPASRCDAHHVTWWRNSGKTDIENLVLLCAHHHTVIHSGRWTLTMRDGVPWAIPPASRDPDRVPLRNTAHTAVHDATQLGRQLVLGLDSQAEPPNPDPPADG